MAKLATVSPASTTGPYFPIEFSDGSEDLTHRDGHTALGQHILLTGRVLEKGDKPTRNMVIEIWQTDANGIFRHPLDPSASEADPGFWGWGRARTDKEGWYAIRTVIPGWYADQDVMRGPHINVAIIGIGLTRRLVTTIFFSAHPATPGDPVLGCVPPDRRPRLFVIRDSSLDRDALPAYRFDFILHGDTETPFFLD